MVSKDDYYDDGGHGGDEDGDDRDDESESSAADADDVVAAMRKRRKETEREIKSAMEKGEITNVVATRWEDSQLAREQAARAAMAGKTGKHETVRDSQEAAKEEFEREEEKSKNLARDPLGIIKSEDFNLRDVDKSQAELFEQALLEIQEELQKAEAAGDEAMVSKIAQQKESLESLIDRMGGIEALENAANIKQSVLPTNPDFDPRLFLTLVHRGADYKTLVGSLDRLSSKTENQVEQLQNLVRENFPLFVRCAEGYEEFRKTSQRNVGMGVDERVTKLEAIAETATYQAKKSFKPVSRALDRCCSRADKLVVSTALLNLFVVHVVTTSPTAVGQYRRGSQGTIRHGSLEPDFAHFANPGIDATAFGEPSLLAGTKNVSARFGGRRHVSYRIAQPSQVASRRLCKTGSR